MAKYKDALGDRMKSFYEDITRYYIPRRTYTLIRIDGKAFHTYTKGLNRPFDEQLMLDMDAAAIYVAQNLQGCKLGYVQSDEMSFLLTDFEDINTQGWFEGNVQKMASVSASYATAKFNELRPGKLAIFDSRVWTIPQKIEVENYFIFRQQDCTKNSISSVAQTYFSAKQLEGKNGDMKQEMLFTEKGINWNDFSDKCKRGRVIMKEKYMKGDAERSRWISVGAPIFTKDREFLNNLIP